VIIETEMKKNEALKRISSTIKSFRENETSKKKK
jgi:hypothetical protein